LYSKAAISRERSKVACRGSRSNSLQRTVSTPTPLRGEQWEKELAPILG
jgi:hypothetical protein